VFVAVVLGAAAAVATYGYLGAVRREAQAGNQMTQVLVATQDIPQGMSCEEMISSGAAEQVRMPRRYIAEGAISSFSAVADRVLASPLSKGEMLTTQRFQLPSSAGLAFTVPKDFVAVTVPVNESRGLAGLLKPGDRVALVATIETTDEKTKEKTEMTRIAIPGARVLAVGSSTERAPAASQGQPNQGNKSVAFAADKPSGQTGQTQVLRSVTLALSPTDAEKVVFATEVGKIWLALLPATGSSALPGLGQTASTVLQ
jgi:pilus assembly protein CpaB